MERPGRRSGGRWGALVAVLACLTALACTKPTPAPAPGTAEVPPPSGGGVVGVNPDVVTTPGTQTSVVSYGPFTVPAATGPGHGQEGMLENILANIEKPCTSCYVTTMHTVLRYPDGREANIDTGQWLHHAVFASWPHSDAVCPVSLIGLLGERFFATGNERTRARFPAGYGYQIGATDRWQVMYDLMNTTMQPATVEMVSTYEWVPATTPGMKALRPVWFDNTGQCNNSGLPAAVGRYSYSMDWVVSRPGKVIGYGAHMHDGGTHVTLTNMTTGEMICTVVGGYGGPGYEEPGGGDHGGDHGADHGGAPPGHLSSMSECMAPTGDQPVAVITAGQRLRQTVYYDTNLHAPDGDHPVMGIGIIYVATQ